MKGKGRNTTWASGSGDRFSAGMEFELVEEVKSSEVVRRITALWLLLCFLPWLCLLESLADKGSGARKILMNNYNWVGTRSLLFICPRLEFKKLSDREQHFIIAHPRATALM